MAGLQTAFAAILLFGVSPALLATGAKMPPAGRRTAHKRRKAGVEGRDIAASNGEPGGHKKARPIAGRVVIYTVSRCGRSPGCTRPGLRLRRAARCRRGSPSRWRPGLRRCIGGRISCNSPYRPRSLLGYMPAVPT